MTGLPAFRLDGSVALVTGAGSGIGRATALALAASGASVACTDQPGRGEPLRRLADEIRAMGVDAIDATLDVTATVTISTVMDQIAARLGALDILVNNAGAQILKPALDLEEAEFDQVLAVNLKGAFFCAQAAAAIMIEARGGTIINIASQHGVVGNRLRAAYCASKGGLINLTRALAVEWADAGIRVNAVSPTFVDNIGNRAFLQQEAVQTEICDHTPLRRVATMDEIAAGIVYLASPAAAMVTGHNLLIDGGWTAR